MIDPAELKRIPIFRDLSLGELERIKHLVFEQSFRQGQMLFMEGMKGDLFYIVKKGRVNVFMKKGDQEITIASLGSGDFIGEMAVIDSEPRSASARVSEEAALFIITRQCFSDIMKVIPEGTNKILLAILRVVHQRLRETNRKLTSA